MGLLHQWRATKPIWVASVSGVCDSLSQWRAYGGHVGGFAVGFTRESLDATANQNDATFVDCLYTPGRRDEIIERFAAPIRHVRRHLVAVRIDPDAKDVDRYQAMKAVGRISGSQLEEFYPLAPQLKDENFKEEEEWRIIVTFEPDITPCPNREFIQDVHTKGSLIAPHIELKLDLPHAIGGILVGPGHPTVPGS